MTQWRCFALTPRSTELKGRLRVELVFEQTPTASAPPPNRRENVVLVDGDAVSLVHVGDNACSARGERQSFVSNYKSFHQLRHERVVPSALRICKDVADAVNVGDCNAVTEALGLGQVRDYVGGKLHCARLGAQVEHGLKAAERVAAYHRPVGIAVRDTIFKHDQVDADHGILEERDRELALAGDVSRFERSAPCITMHVSTETRSVERALTSGIVENEPMRHVARNRCSC